MIKILYGARESQNSKIQLQRILDNNTNFDYKIAAYKNHCPNVNLDITLDIFKKENNKAFEIFLEQVNYFKPDVVISDLEYFTSKAAIKLKIPLIQCTNYIHQFVTSKKNNVMHNYKFPKQDDFIHKSDYIFLYSHFGDVEYEFKIRDKCEWIRPYYKLGKDSVVCKHNLLAALFNNDKNIYKILNDYEDCVVFNNYILENYKNITLKSFDDIDEYYCNLKNSESFICRGDPVFLDDAYYNGKHSYIILDKKTSENIATYELAKKLGHGTLFSQFKPVYSKPDFIPNYNDILFFDDKLTRILR